MKRTTVKKILALTGAFILTITVSGCYLGTAAKERGQGRETGLKLVEYINDKDTDSIVQLFSEKVQERFDLKEGIENLYAVLGSDIKSYKRLNSTDSEVWYDDWKLTHAIISVEFYDVITEDGMKFKELSVSYIAVDKDEDNVGIAAISLCDDDKETAVVGGYIE